MKNRHLIRLCAGLSLLLAVACTQEKQTDCLPCRETKMVALYLDEAPAAEGLNYALWVFRRPAGAVEEYVFDRSFASVADGAPLQLPMAELNKSDYRFLMLALPADDGWLALRTAEGASVGTGTTWDELRLAVTAAASADGYCGVQDLTGTEIYSHGVVRLTLKRVAGQFVFDFYRIGTSVNDPQSVVSPTVASVFDRVSQIEITYSGATTQLRFDADNNLVPAAHATEPTVQTIVPELVDFHLSLPQPDKGLKMYDAQVGGSVRVEGLCWLPSEANMRIRMVFTYFDTTAACNNQHLGEHTETCYASRQLTLDMPQASAPEGLPVKSDYLTVNRAGIRTDRVIDVPAGGAVEAEFGWE